MNNKSTTQKIASLFSFLFIAVYRYFRDKPSTCIDLVKYPGSRLDDYMQDNLSALRGTILIDKLIDNCIEQHGITEYKNKSLYDLDSYDLNNALTLIQHGMVKATDFTSEEPISSIITLSLLGLNSLTYIPKDLWTDVFGNIVLKDKARRIAKTQEEYTDLHYRFAFYEFCRRVNEHLTQTIDNYTENYPIGEYMGQSLYEIKEYDLLEEALNAIDEIDTLIYTGIESYKGKDVRTLSYFEVKQANRDTHDDTCTHFGFDEARRAEFLKDEAKYHPEDEERELKEEEERKRKDENYRDKLERLREQYIELQDERQEQTFELQAVKKALEKLQEQQLKRNAAARERRAKLKAEAMRAQNKKKPKQATIKTTAKKPSRKVQTA